MSFSAGTVVLEVWPSFRNMQREMQAQGRAAGREYGRGLDRELNDTQDDAARAGARAGGAFSRAMRAAVERIPATIDADASPARRELFKLREEARILLEEFEAGRIDVDTAAATAQIRAFMAQAEALTADGLEIDVRTDAGAMRRALSDLLDFHERSIGMTRREQADELAAVRSHNDDLVQQLRNREGRMAAVLRNARVAEREARERFDREGGETNQAAAVAAVRARYQAEERYAQAAARARVAASLRASTAERISAQMVERAVEQSYDEQTDAATRAAAQRAAIARIAARSEASAGPGFLRQAWVQNVGQAANSFRLFNGVLLTSITLGPLLIPVLAGIAAGLGGVALMGMAAFGAIGVLVAALGGIGGAVGALDELERQTRLGTGPKSSRSSGPSITDQRQLRDAQLALARAREDAGRRIADATRRQEDAERDLARTQRDVKQAQDDLTQARRDAADAVIQMRADLRKGQVDEGMAKYDMQEAAAQYKAILEDPQATAREKEYARLQLEGKKNEYRELQRENEKLRKQLDDIDSRGIDSTEGVIAAKKRLRDAIDQVGEAERRVRDAEKEVARARVEEARTLFDAQRRVSDAMYDLQHASNTAGMAGTDAFNNVREALDKLSPAGQDFARFLYSLKPLLDAIRDAAQTGLLPGLQRAISTIVDKYGDKFIDFVGVMAEVLGDLFEIAADELTNPWWESFFDTMADIAPGLLRDLGTIIGALATGFAGIMQAFAPFADEFADVVVRLAEGFADWGKALGSSDSFDKFMEYVRRVGPKVLRLIELMAELLLNLMIGLAPYAEKLIDLFITILEWATSIDPSTLALIALAIGAIVAAVQVLAGIMAAVSSTIGLIVGLVTLFGSGGALAGIGAAIAAAAPVIGIVLAIVAALALLVGGFVYAYNTSETFRDRVNAAVQAVKDGFDTFMERVQEVFDGISGIFREVATAWGILLGPVVTFFRTVLAPTFTWLWTDIIKPVFDLIGGIFQIAWGVFRTFGDIIYQVITRVIGPIVSDLYYKYIKPIWENYIRPAFEALGNFIEENVAPAFERGRDAIGTIWSGILDLVKAPIKFFVEVVLNKGIIDNFNKLVSIFPGIEKIDHVNLPSGWDSTPTPNAPRGPRGHGNGRAFATGGIMPGYTPGRDVHTFFSPTAGVLELSGGEPVLRPEVGRVLGSSWVNGINAAARRGGVSGVQSYLGGYSSGGFIGGIGDFIGDAIGDVRDAIGGAVGSLADLARNPSKVLRKVVETLLGSDPQGFNGLLAGVAYKVVDAIGSLLPGAGNNTGHFTPGGPAMGYQAMSGIIEGAFPSARITSGYRRGARTVNGGQSYHALGRAVDIAPPSMAIFNWLSENYPNATELLYSPAGARQILRRGLRGDTGGLTKQMHYNHVHWAMRSGGIVPNLYDNGGALPPGLSLIANRTGKPEQVLTSTQWREIRQGGNTYNQFEIERMGADAREVAYELDRIRRDRLAVAGLNAAENLG